MVAAKITKTEALILGLYTSGFPTPKQIAARLKKSPDTIKVHLCNLRRKGLLSVAGNVTVKEGGVGGKEGLRKWGDSPRPIRLHAQQFRIGILYAAPSYKQLLKGCNELRDFDKNFVKLHEDVIEIYSNQEFYGSSAEEAFGLSLEYWTNFAHRLEARLNVLLIKPGGVNWKAVKAGEYAYEGSEVAQAAALDGEKIYIRTNDDGKVWYVADWSKPQKGPEDETVHPITSMEDRHTVDHYYNDMRDNAPPTLSEIAGLLRLQAREGLRQVELNRETAAGLNAVVQLMKPAEPPKQTGPDVRPWYVG